jgi:hypothetical protein
MIALSAGLNLPFTQSPTRKAPLTGRVLFELPFPHSIENEGIEPSAQGAHEFGASILDPEVSPGGGRQ